MPASYLQGSEDRELRPIHTCRTDREVYATEFTPKFADQYKGYRSPWNQFRMDVWKQHLAYYRSLGLNLMPNPEEAKETLKGYPGHDLRWGHGVLDLPMTDEEIRMWVLNRDNGGAGRVGNLGIICGETSNASDKPILVSHRTFSPGAEIIPWGKSSKIVILDLDTDTWPQGFDGLWGETPINVGKRGWHVYAADPGPEAREEILTEIRKVYPRKQTGIEFRRGAGYALLPFSFIQYDNYLGKIVREWAGHDYSDPDWWKKLPEPMILDEVADRILL